MNVEKIRKDFAPLDRVTFLANCRTSIPPKQTVEAAKKFVEEAGDRTALPLKNDREDKAVEEAAELVGAKEKEITFIHTTSEGTAATAEMIDFEKGDNIIIDDMEFMSNVIPWKIKEKKEGIEVRIVKNKNGKFTPQDIEEKINEKTKVISLSSVQECNGFRCDIEKIGKIAKEHDCLFIIDSIQQLGAIDIDVKKSKIDVMAAGGAKWLLNPYGAGIYFVNEKILDELDPAYYGWSNIEQPEQGWLDVLGTSEYTPIKEYSIRNDKAKKYSLPITDLEAGIPALASSLNYINDIGIDNIQERIFRLTDILIENIEEDKIKIVSPTESKEERSGIISIRTKDDHRVMEVLNDKDIVVSLSYASGAGGIRISPHFFNTEEEVLKCCNTVNETMMDI
ncbi:MAG: aminotransferase class V-fold PLP-dependent enzyme [Thermoplasmata archaeon]